MRSKSLLPTLFFAVLFVKLPAALAEAPLPELPAYRTNSAPVIDGNLDEDCWAKAPVTKPFWKLDGSAKVENSAQGRVAFDDANLYIAFHSPFKDAGAAQKARETPKDSVWNEETLEIFLAPFSDNQTYFQFALSPSNAHFTQKNSAYPWSNPWESATSIGADAWDAEIKIPFASLASVDGKSSSTWRINLAHGATMWAPTFDSYHQPSKFGRLTGIDAPLGDYRWLVALGPGNMTDGPSLALQLYHQAGRTLNIKYALDTDDSPPEKGWHFEKSDYSQETLADRVLNVPAPLTKPGPHGVRVTISDRDSGRALAYLTTSVEGLQSSLTVWDRSFYMNETFATLLISSTNKGAPGGLVKCILRPAGKTTQLQTVALRLDKKGKGTARFSLKRLSAGEYEVRLEGSSGLELDAPATRPLRKLAFKAGAVQYTHEGVLLRDGNPTFPFGVYYVRPYFKRDANMAKEYAEAGFNTYPMEWGNAQGFTEELIAQKKNGLTPFVGIQNAAEIKAIDYNGPQTLDDWENAARRLVREVSAKAGDNIFAWYTWDEPSLGLWADVTKRFYDVARMEDPYHPTFLCSNNPGIFKTLTGMTDILGIDPYPGFPNGRLGSVADWVDAACQAAPNRPVITVLQSFYDEGGRMPTPEELRCMTYLSIVHGTKGILYFSYDYRVGIMPEKEPAAWKALQNLAGETGILAPALLDKPTKALAVQKVYGANMHFKICGRYLIAVNAEKEKTRAQFSLKGIRPDGKLKVFGENRDVALRGSFLDDDFAAYAVHIYELK